MSSPGQHCRRRFFPRARLGQVGTLPVQADLRRAFTRWGLPARIRVDNGAPGGAEDASRGDRAAGLTGVGTEMIWSPPRRPQANGVGERSPGVEKNWAEPWTCADANELPRRAEETDRRQREAYAGPGEQPRGQEFPGLAHAGRTYRPDLEDALGDLERVK